jgi:SAM-dependent methyltransferase
VALTLRAVGGLTTREIADAFFVPEATMAQRISRAKRTLRGRPFDQPGDLAVVLRVLYLVYTAGHAGRVDLAGEAIRLARQLTLVTEEPEARGLLALMLLNHARRAARIDAEGRIVTLDRQDRGLWDRREIAEGVRVLQSALALQTEVRRPGRYQVQAAIAALHDDAAGAAETDWPQILAWYDDLVALADDPVRQDPAAVLARAVAVGHVLGAAAGLRETDRLVDVIGDRHRWHAVRGYLHELDGDLPAAATAYAEAARRATNVAERDHLVRQAARARASAAGDGELARAQREHWEGTYDTHPGMYGDQPSAAAQHAAAAFRAAGVRDVLELGAGHGRDALFFAREGFRVRATDFSAVALDQLRATAGRTGVAADVDTTVHDVRDPLPLPDASVDAVFAHMLLCMALSTAEIEALVAEIRRVLRPGGTFVYTVRHTGDAHYATGVAHGDDIFEQGGFAVHFFPRHLVDRLAVGWQLVEVHPFEEGDLPRRLWRVTQTLPG